MWLFDIKFQLTQVWNEKKMNRFALALAKGQIVGLLEHDDDLSRSSNERSKKTRLKEDIDLRSISINGQYNHISRITEN
jgi:hypothetical protein